MKAEREDRFSAEEGRGRKGKEEKGGVSKEGREESGKGGDKNGGEKKGGLTTRQVFRGGSAGGYVRLAPALPENYRQFQVISQLSLYM